MKNVILLRNDAEADVLSKVSGNVKNRERFLSETALDDFSVIVKSEKLESGLVFEFERMSPEETLAICDNGWLEKEQVAPGTAFFVRIRRTMYRNTDVTVESYEFIIHRSRASGRLIYALPSEQDTYRVHAIEAEFNFDGSRRIVPLLMKTPEKRKQCACAATGFFFGAQFLMLHHRELLTYCVESSKESKNDDPGRAGPGGKKKRRSGKRGRVSVVRLYHIIDPTHLEDRVKRGAGAKHVVTCPVWGVRGHYRRLANGRTVYVRPYKKGKERGRTEETTIYTLFPTEKEADV